MKETSNGKEGGLLKGKPHYDKEGNPMGGIKAVVTDNNKEVELEGGEVVIKKKAVQDPKVKTITGTNKEILHKINTEAGGTPILAEGGEIEDKNEVYSKWKRLVNMSASELQAFLKTPEGKKAGLTYEEAKKEGINNGKQSAKWIIRMKNTPKDKWSKAMWKWANKQISFISRMSGVDGALYDDKGNKTRKHTALLIWGHNPKKMAEGGELDDFDWNSLYNPSPEEQKRRDEEDKVSSEKEKENWYQGTRFSKKWAATYKEAVDRTVKEYLDAKATYDDWGSRKYKSNKGMVFLGGDDVFGEAKSIGSINEGRRQRVLRGSKMIMDESLETLKELGLSQEEINKRLGIMKDGGEVKETQLSGESQYVINYLRSKKAARITLKKSNPKYDKQIEGLQDAIKHGYITITENPINEEVYIRPTLKLRDSYKFELGGEITTRYINGNEIRKIFSKIGSREGTDMEEFSQNEIKDSYIYVLKDVSIEDLLSKDEDLAGFVYSELDEYKKGRAITEPILLGDAPHSNKKNVVRDGYGRVTQAVKNGDKTIKAYYKIEQ